MRRFGAAMVTNQADESFSPHDPIEDAMKGGNSLSSADVSDGCA